MDKTQLQVEVGESKPEPPKYDYQQAPPDPQPQKTEETTVYREEHHTSSSIFGWFVNATTKELKARLSSIFIIAILCIVCLAVGSSFIFDESLNESAYNLGKAAWALMIIHVSLCRLCATLTTISNDFVERGFVGLHLLLCVSMASRRSCRRLHVVFPSFLADHFNWNCWSRGILDVHFCHHHNRNSHRLRVS